MPSIAVLKTFLSVVFLAGITLGLARAAETPSVFRFGEWVIFTPPGVTAEVLSAGAALPRNTPPVAEFLAYWRDGKERALSIRFHYDDASKDVIQMRDNQRNYRVKGCKLGSGRPFERLEKLISIGPEGQMPTMTNFPSGGAVHLPGVERSLRREVDLLIADFGAMRLQLSEDSSVVRVGLWQTGDFCRFELGTPGASDDNQDD